MDIADVYLEEHRCSRQMVSTGCGSGRQIRASQSRWTQLNGTGSAPDLIHGYMWSSLAAKRGDAASGASAAPFQMRDFELQALRIVGCGKWTVLPCGHKTGSSLIGSVLTCSTTCPRL